MRELCDGHALHEAAERVLEDVPSIGRVAFLSSSLEGAALAAARAVIRADGSHWRHVNLLAPAAALADPVVFVEPVFPGRAWEDAVDRAYPGCMTRIPAARPGYAADDRSAASAAAAA
jgi:hypothetical protein